MDDYKDVSYDELNYLQQLNSMKSYKIIEQENQNLLIMRWSNSTSLSVKHNESTSTDTFLRYLFTQYLHKVLTTILHLQPFL